MDEARQVTQFVLRLIMVVYLTVGLGILLSPNYYRKAFEKMFENKAVTYLAGIISLVVGFGIVSYHNLWTGWATLITLFGWIAFLKGLSVLIFPEYFMKTSTKMVKNQSFYVYGLLAIVLGLIFGYFGYFSVAFPIESL